MAFAVSSMMEAQAIERFADLLLDELNVKSLRPLGSAGEAVSYSIKPLPRQLGQKYKAKFPQIAAVVSKLDPSKMAPILLEGKGVKVTVDGDIQDIYGQTLDEDTTLTFKIGPAESLLVGPNQIFMTMDPAASEPVFSVYALNYNTLELRVYAVQPSDWPEALHRLWRMRIRLSGEGATRDLRDERWRDALAVEPVSAAGEQQSAVSQWALALG